ncbi:MAG TPA: hypothetical protein VFZ67_12740 [Nitrososphaera sp.]
MDATAKDPNVSHSVRLKSESVELEALAILRDAIEASIYPSDPHIVLEKIVEKSNRRRNRRSHAKKLCQQRP